MAENEGNLDIQKRRERIEFLKKVIVWSRRVGLIFPWIVVIILIVWILQLKAGLRRSNDMILEYGAENERLNFEIDKLDEDYTKEIQNLKDESGAKTGTIAEMSAQDMQNLSEEQLYDGYRKVYLTFDDGPSTNTEAILDILAKYNVKATFFVIYKAGRDNEALYRRIVEEGHTLGMHSCTHEYSVVYASEEGFAEDTQKLQDFLYMVTGVESKVYRFPGGSSNKVSNVDIKALGKILKDKGINYYDWNVSSQDASNPILSKEEILYNVMNGLERYNVAMVLMHDTASKVTTVEALPEMIERIQSMEKTVILPITDETYPIQQVKIN